MDTYLPADFHRLHDTVAADWRDAASAPVGPIAAPTVVRVDTLRERERSVDPGWLAI